MWISIIYTRILFILLPAVLICSCSRQPGRIPDQNNLIIYPAPPAKTRIQYLTSFSSSSEFKGKQKAINKFLFGEKAPLPIVKPYGIAIHESKIYICDTGIGGLEILDLSENSFEYFIPAGKGQLQLPINCHIDSEGNIYIADGNRKQVVIFDQELKYLDEITLEGNAKPTDLFVDDSKIWISAVDDHKILIYKKSDLSFLRSFPDNIIENEAYLYQPANINILDSNIYVSDFGDCRIKIFDTDLNYKKDFGGAGRGFGQFTRPKGISTDNSGNIYVVDAAFENIQIFNPSGDLLMHFGGTYNGPGGMWLPADVTINYSCLEYFEDFVDDSFELEYLIFVTNQYGPDKVSVYGFVGLTE